MRTHALLVFGAALGATLAAAPLARAGTLQVGPGKAFAKPCDAIAVAHPGDVIEVDAGSYDGDTCSWSTDNLTVRGVGGLAKIDDTGVAVAADKGIFDINAPNATVENFELSGAVDDPNSKNGAGIRHQGLNLTVRGCVFHDNEDGILGAPSTDGQGEVLIDSSEFYANGHGDGQSHNMYLNHYAKFTLQYSYSHDANAGHLVKSRALTSYILYNRLSDDASTNVSYEVNLPNGGDAYVIGNVIVQSPDPNGDENGTIVDFGSEGPIAASALFVVNNTIVNRRQNGGIFVGVDARVTTASVLTNNVFFGPGTVCNQASAVLTASYTGASPGFVDEPNDDFHLTAGSPCVDGGMAPGTGNGVSLTPTQQYVHPVSHEGRMTVGTIDIGAFELGGAVSTGSGGAGGSATSGPGATGSGGATGATTSGAGGASTTSGPGATSGTSGTASTGAGNGSSTGQGAGSPASTGASRTGAGGSGGGAAADQASDSGGCGCRVAGDEAPIGALAAFAALAAVAAARRRRRVSA